MMLRNKRRWRKGEMAKTIVVYCIRVLTGVLIWAVVLKTLCPAYWVKGISIRTPAWGVSIFGWNVAFASVFQFAPPRGG